MPGLLTNPRNNVYLNLQTHLLCLAHDTVNAHSNTFAYSRTSIWNTLLDTRAHLSDVKKASE